MDRRDFIRTSALAGAAATAAHRRAQAAPAPRYPRAKLASLSELRAGPKLAHYPDEASPVHVAALGRAVEGGAGPRRDVVAYSALCTHRGCQVSLERDRLVCPCHFSAFDPAKGGACYQGVASVPLPRITLEVRGDDVFAVGVEGLLYGRVDNR